MRRFVKERQIPTKKDKVRALVDKWFFLDMIGFHGGNAAFGGLHKELLEWYDGDRRTSKRDLLLLPRGHLKTTIITVLDILHSVYVNPNIRIYIGSANQKLSKAILREVATTLVDPWLQEHVWNSRPHIEGRLIPLMDKLNQSRRRTRRELDFSFSEWDEDMISSEDNKEEEENTKKVIWRQEEIQVLRQYTLKEPTVVCGSTESPVTGFHYDKLYFDDIINFENYDKLDKIERLDTWRNDMFSVLDDEYYDEDLYDWLCSTSRSPKYREVFKHMSYVGGDCTVVGTRYFRHDWYKQLLDEEDSIYREFVKNIYVNGEDNTDGYIWSERWNTETEHKRRKQMSKKHFYAQYLNKVIVTEEQILRFDNVKFIHASQILQKDTNRVWITTKDANGDNIVREVVLFACVDPAATCNKTSDFTACVVGGKDKDKNLYVLDVRLWRLPPDKWVKEMYGVLDKWKLKSISLETVAFFVTMKDTIKRYFNEFYPVSIRDYKPSNRTSKKERIETGLEPLLSNGMLYMTTWCKSNNELVDQFNFFPSDTVHDDGIDVIQQLNEICKPTVPIKETSKNQSTQRYNTKYGGAY